MPDISGLMKWAAIIALIAMVGVVFNAFEAKGIAEGALAAEEQKNSDLKNELGVAENNAEVIGNEYSKLQDEQAEERLARMQAERVAKVRGAELRALMGNLADPYSANIINVRLHSALEKANGFAFDNPTNMPQTGSPSVGPGPWFCFDKGNAEALVNNIFLLSDYVAANEDDDSSKPP